MGRGHNQVDATGSILYGNMPRQIPEQRAAILILAAELSPSAQIILKHIYRLSQQALKGKRSRKTWSASFLRGDIDWPGALIEIPSVRSISAQLAYMEKKELVYSIQGTHMPRLQWSVSETGRKVAETL